MPHTPTPAANLFGSKSFWTIAVIAAIAFGASTYINTENQKADAAKEDARIHAKATESTAADKCRSFVTSMNSGPRFRILGTSIAQRRDLGYLIDVKYETFVGATGTMLTTTYRCDMYWSGYDDAWDVRAR